MVQQLDVVALSQIVRRMTWMTAVAFDDVASDVGAAFSFNEYFCMFIIIISEKTHSALLVVRIGCNELSTRKQKTNVFQLSEDQRSDDACLFLLFLLALCAMPTKPKKRNSGQSGISKRCNWIRKDHNMSHQTLRLHHIIIMVAKFSSLF